MILGTQETHNDLAYDLALDNVYIQLDYAYNIEYDANLIESDIPEHVPGIFIPYATMIKVCKMGVGFVSVFIPAIFAVLS